ncbi:MAG: hypothetical protein LKK00_02110 [Intestinimonas sp.]|jgi:hypothetical protein|nr:hypothetical protein [Intestinimonas sp.]
MMEKTESGRLGGSGDYEGYRVSFAAGGTGGIGDTGGFAWCRRSDGNTEDPQGRLRRTFPGFPAEIIRYEIDPRDGIII